MNATQSSTSQGKRERFTAEQVEHMERLFQLTPLPTNQQKLELTDRLSISRRRIQVWFQNRRSKAKRQLSAASTTHPLADTPILEPPTEQPSAYNMTSTMPSRRPLARPTAYVYQPTYALDNLFNDTDPDLQQQRYSPAFVFNHANQTPGAHCLFLPRPQCPSTRKLLHPYPWLTHRLFCFMKRSNHAVDSSPIQVDDQF